MNILRWLLLLMPLLLHSPARAAEDGLKPFILSSNVEGDMAQRVIEVKEALLGGGFEWVGEYRPDPDRYILIVTNDHLKAVADDSPGGYFLLPLRVAITRVDGKLQLSYTNPVYYAHAYRVQADMDDIRVRLQEILGMQRSFGASGLTAEVLASYRYSFGMEQFDDLLQLADFASQDQALTAIERGFSRQSGRVEPVFRLDLPGQAGTLFGIAIKSGPGSDQAVTSALDVSPLRHTARMPWTLLVLRGRVVALHPRFKLPLDFPAMARTGEHSFSAILRAPGAIEQALRGLFEAPAE